MIAKNPGIRAYERHALHSTDQGIYCQLCGWGPRHVLWQHLHWHHQMTVAEYRARWPEAPVASPHFRAAAGDITRDRVDVLREEGRAWHAEVWTRESVIRALRRYKKQPPVNQWNAEGRSPSLKVMRRLFGSWNKAWRAAGFATRRQGSRRRKACRKGHPLVGWNVYVRPNGIRVCRACKRARSRAAYAQRKAGPVRAYRRREARDDAA